MIDDIVCRLANIGERITEARKKAGFTHQQVGEFTSVTEDTVRSWEASLSRPSLVKVEELASRCDVTPDWLLGRDLIEEVFLEEAKHSYVCINGHGLAVDELPLVDLDSIREFILYAKRRQRTQGAKAPAHSGILLSPPTSEEENQA